MIKQTETAEYTAFDRNRELSQRLRERCETIDKQMEKHLVKHRDFTVVARNFIHEVKKSTGYFLPAWWQEEKTPGLDDVEAKRRASLAPVQLGQLQKKPPIKIRPKKFPKKSLLKSSLKHATNNGDTQESPRPRPDLHVVLVDTASITAAGRLPPLEHVPSIEMPAQPPDKTLNGQDKLVDIQEEEEEEEEKQEDPIDFIFNHSKPKIPSKKAAFASLSEAVVPTKVVIAQPALEPIQKAQPAASTTAITDLTGDQNEHKGADSPDDNPKKLRPSSRLFERIRTMSFAQFNRLLDEIDSTDITPYLPDYAESYPMATRLGPSMRQHVDDYERSKSKTPPAASTSPFDAEEIMDIRELMTILNGRGLTGSKARLYLTRIFGKHHLKALQRPNYGLKPGADGAAQLEHDLGGRIGAFRNHYRTLPELMMGAEDETANEIAKAEAEAAYNKRNKIKVTGPPPLIANTKSRLLRRREGTKLPYLPTETSSNSLLLPFKYRYMKDGREMEPPKMTSTHQKVVRFLNEIKKGI